MAGMHIPNYSEIASLASELGRDLDESRARGLAVYVSELLKWNSKLNLVGASDWRRIMSELVADSWHLADFMEKLPLPAEPRSLDIGAGAGLPGIPLRIFNDSGEYVLVEPRQKRAAFLQNVLAKLRLPRTRVLNCRAEELGEDMRDFDLVLGRAVMNWRDFIELSAGYLAPGGICVIFASEPLPEAAPPGFSSGPVHEYRAVDKKRYFWSFSPGTPANCSK
jgi:16S rRNA (guanine527-N7)-methyltransferase